MESFWGGVRGQQVLRTVALHTQATSPGAPLGLLAPGSVQWPSAHFGGLLLGLGEAAPRPEWVPPW